MDDDRERWNAVWSGRGEAGPPAGFLVEHEALLPRAGRALDIAGGAGRHAIWLARRGLAVTMVDVSDAGLEVARRSGLPIELVRLDLDVDPLPPGPFDLVLCVGFLDRAHRDGYVERIAPGGLLVMAMATRTNLERHARPSERYLLAPGELDAWARGLGLEVLVSREGWNAEGRHQAELIGRVSR
jgi:SAM-dependent methyltransferase